MAAAYRRLGVISNPRSHGNRAGTGGLRAPACYGAGLLIARPATHAALTETLREFAAAGVDLLAVDGGDGTLRDVLTALPLAWPHGAPALALLRGGNTNLAARVLGGFARGHAGLVRLVRAAESGRLRRRRCAVLEVSWVGCPDRLAQRGLFLGAAGFAEGKRIADTEIARLGLHHAAAVAAAAALALLRALGGRLAAGSMVGVTVEGVAARAGLRCLVLATTLDRLVLGLWPFWGAGAGDIRWLDIDAPPLRLASAMLPALRGRPRAWMADAGYRSGRAEHLRLTLDRPFILDGEFFDPGPAGILLCARDQVEVVAP